MNRISFIGNLGQDASVNQLESGARAIKFSVAVTEKYGDKENTTWINCTMWKTPAQEIKIANYLKKGVKVYVEGKPSASAYKNKQGEIVASLECRIDRLEFVSQISNDAEKQGKKSIHANDDMPF